MSPLISVIIPMYNGEKYIKEAVESVLAQEYTAIEVIIVDDGSIDHSAQIVKGFGNSVKYFYQENAGQVSALNAGIGYAQGEVIGFVDADDLWAPNKISVLLPRLLQKEQTYAVVGELQRFWEDEAGEKQFLPKEKAMSLLAGLFRKEVFEKVGRINGELVAHYDIDFYMRMKELKLHIEYIADAVGFYRRHGENMSSNSDQEDTNKAMLSLLRSSIARRRELQNK